MKILRRKSFAFEETLPSQGAHVCVPYTYTESCMVLIITLSQRIFREMIVWYKLLDSPHQNLVDFYGFVENIEHGFGLVSPLFSRGNITEYLRRNPSANRAALVSRSPIYGHAV